MTRQLFREVLVAIAAATIAVAIHAADLTEYYREQNYPPPSMPPVGIPAPPVPRCSYEREVEHDDILGTNDWVERQICD
jgi:hypothetical protein